MTGKGEETSTLLKSMKHLSSNKNILFLGGADAYDVAATSEVGEYIASLGPEDMDTVMKDQ